MAPIQFRAHGAGRRKLVMAALPVAILVAVSGAIAALGDTLFPAASVASGIRQEFSQTASALLRLRVLHPVLAVAGGAACSSRSHASHAIRTAAHRHDRGGLVCLQLAAGALNIALLAPVWMQIMHLLLADLLWVALVLMTVETGWYRIRESAETVP